MDRRAFLAATPLVLGIENLLGQEAAEDWLGEARRRMRTTGRFGLVLVAPDRDPIQKKLGEALWDFTRSAADRALLAEAVLVCVLPARAKEIGAQAGRLVLLSPAGEVLDSSPVEIDTFAAAAESLLRGRRAARAAAIEESLDDGLRAALKKLDVEDLETREQAFTDVSAAADRIAPLLAHLARSGRTEELRGRAAGALIRLYEKAVETAPGPKLPYGARLPRLVSAGCGGERELPEDFPKEREREFVVACGLARLPDGPARRFLRFLSK